LNPQKYKKIYKTRLIQTFKEELIY
jgi:hypothetical protein